MNPLLVLARMKAARPDFEPGHVWLAGAGPGSLETLTLGVLSAIVEADAIVYDALVDPAILEYADGAELHFAGKRGGQVSESQASINALLVDLARSGKRVLRLKGGDPFIFGRGGEEVLHLKANGVPFRVLAGVTSAFGAAASAAIPTTMRGINKAVILATGHGCGAEADLDWHALAKTGQPIVVYMGLTNLARIANALIEGGLPVSTPAAIVMSATLPDEKVLQSTLGSIAHEAEAAGFASPSLVFIGEIVALRDELLAELRGAAAE